MRFWAFYIELWSRIINIKWVNYCKQLYLKVFDIPNIISYGFFYWQSHTRSSSATVSITELVLWLPGNWYILKYIVKPRMRSTNMVMDTNVDPGGHAHKCWWELDSRPSTTTKWVTRPAKIEILKVTRWHYDVVQEKN